MRREERVTVQGPVKKQRPDEMSHGGAKARQVCQLVFSSVDTRLRLEKEIVQMGHGLSTSGPPPCGQDRSWHSLALACACNSCNEQGMPGQGTSSICTDRRALSQLMVAWAPQELRSPLPHPGLAWCIMEFGQFSVAWVVTRNPLACSCQKWPKVGGGVSARVTFEPPQGPCVLISSSWNPNHIDCGA